MKKQIGFLLAGAGLMVGGLGATAVTARQSMAGGEGEVSGHGFCDRTIKGWWGYNTEVGYLVPPAVPEAIPAAAVGRVYFDGEGHCQVSNIINTNGQSKLVESSSCRYSVKEDGTGTSEAVLIGAPFSEPLQVAFVITDHGRELRMLTTNLLVGPFSARRQ